MRCYVSRLGFLIITILSMLLVGCGGAESRKEKYYQSATENYSNDDCEKATLDFRNVLQIDPKHIPAQVGLAKCLFDEKEWRKAFQLLANANESGENVVEAKIWLAKLYLISGENEKAYGLIEEVLNYNDKNPTAIALRGFFHIKNSSFVAARTDAKTAFDIDGTDISVITLMTALDIKDNQIQQSIDRIQSILADNEISKRSKKELRLILIGLYSQINDSENIANIYANLIQDYPEKSEYTYKLALIHANTGEVDKAENILLSLIESNDDDNQKIAYISFLDRFKSTDEGTKKLQEFINKEPSDNLKIALARRYQAKSNNEEAIKIFEELANNNTGNSASLESKNELAYIALKNNDINTASGIVSQVLTEQPTNLRALIIRGTLALSKRDAPQAIADFRSVLRDQPNNDIIIRQLASAYILNGQEDLAKELIQKAIAINSNNKELGLIYARLQGKDNDYSEALDTVNELLKDRDNDIEIVKTLFDLQVASKDYVAAKETAESIMSTFQDSPLGYYLSGVLLQNEENYAEAEKHYLLALEKEPRGNEPLTGLVRLYLANDQADKAITMLQDVIKKDPQYLVPYNLLGELATSTKDYELAISSFESAIKLNKTWWVPYRGLSIAHALNGNVEASFNELKRGIRNNANIERLGVELAVAQYKLGAREQAIDTYKMILNKNPQSLIAKNNLSMVLVDDNANDENIQLALTYIDDLKSIDDAASFDTIGWVYYRSGNITNALEYLNKAVTKAPKVAELQYHLGMAYLADNNLAKAKEHLALAISSDQDFTGKEVAIDKLSQL